MKFLVRYLFFFIFSWLVLCYPTLSQTGESDIFTRKIQVKKNKGTIYQFLKEITVLTGYQFIYDSQIIDNDKKIKINKGEYRLRDAIKRITQNNNIEMRIIDRHILLYLPSVSLTLPIAYEEKKTEKKTELNKHFILSGTLTDLISGNPIPYGTIGVTNSTIGTISNQDGEFKLILPDSVKNANIKFTHLGYRSQEVSAELLDGQNITISLDPEVIPLQEVIVRLVNPIQVLNEMFDMKEKNYSNKPVYLTTFYREGIEYKKNNTYLTEAVLKIYKNGFASNINTEQVKLLKMRRVENKQESDTLITKMSSGLNSILTLDIIKNIPDFLDIKNNHSYNFAHTDITVIDDKLVNVISFEQDLLNREPLFKGEIYIDIENHALIQAKFEVNKKYIKKAANMYVEKKSKKINITPQEIKYIVTYKPVNGVYYINHVRGDLYFKVKDKKKLFASQLHTWFESVTCDIDSINVTRFPKSDRLPTKNIFSDTKFEYDPYFWGNFNTIMPEEKLRELIVNYFTKH